MGSKLGMGNWVNSFRKMSFRVTMEVEVQENKEWILTISIVIIILISSTFNHFTHHSHLESETDGEKSICFASATETEWREEKIGASAGLSLDLKLVRDQLPKQIINQN